jgi:hypothetical protein
MSWTIRQVPHPRDRRVPPAASAHAPARDVPTLPMGRPGPPRRARGAVGRGLYPNAERPRETRALGRV